MCVIDLDSDSTISRLDLGVVVVMEWQLDLQIHVQSVHITTNVVSSNHAHGEVYSIQHYVIKFISDLRQVGGFSSGTPISSTNKTDFHDITEILLKVAFNTKHHQPSCTKQEKLVVLDMCVIDLVTFSTIFLLDLGVVLTFWYFSLLIFLSKYIYQINSIHLLVYGPGWRSS